MSEWPTCQVCTERPAIMTLVRAGGPGRRLKSGRVLINVCAPCAFTKEEE